MRIAPFVLLAALHPQIATADAGASPVRVAGGDYYAPRFSPDGAHLLVTGAHMRGLSVIDVDTGRARVVSDEPRAGVTARYLADGRIAFRARRAGAERTLVVAANGTLGAVDTGDELAFASGDRIYVRTATGVVAVGSGDRFFGPTVSPDRTRVAFVGLATGIHVYDLTAGSLDHLGPGTAPAWSPDSRTLAYERTEDDGHDIVGSDIWLWQSGASPRRLLATERAIERRPSWSPDGARIAFDDDRGAVYVTEVRR